MMAAVSARGRPRGYSDRILAKAREIFTRHECRAEGISATASVAAIAKQQNVEPASVWGWLRIARETSADVLSEAPAEPEATPKPKPRLTERTLLYRAASAMCSVPALEVLGPSCVLWLRAIVEIHRDERDGDGLSFGHKGDLYASRESFLRAIGGTEADLEILIQRGVLEETEGGGLALPYRFGLRPREPRLRPESTRPSAEDRDPPSARSRRGTPDPRFPPLPLPLVGLPSTYRPDRTEDDSRDIPTGDSNNNPDGTPEKITGDSNENGLGDSKETPFARAAFADADAKENHQSLSNSISTGSPAGDAREARKTAQNGPETPNSDSKKNAFSQSQITAVAERLLSAANVTRSPNLREVALVRDWLSAGVTEEMARAVIALRLGQATTPPVALQYFDAAMRDALASRRDVSSPAEAAVEPEPPETPEATVAWLRDDPDNPRLMDAWTAMRAALRAEVGPGVYRAFLRPMVLRGLDGDEIVIDLPTEILRDVVRDKYGVRIAGLWRPVYPKAHRVDFRVATGPPG